MPISSRAARTGFSALTLSMLRSGSATSVIALAALAVPQAAQAQACGAPSSGTVTCTSVNNPYATGIAYPTAVDLTIVVEGDVSVNSGALDAVRLVGTAPNVDGVVRIADGATLTSNDDGVFAVSQQAGGTTTVDSGAAISATTRGIIAFADAGTSVVNRGDISMTGVSNQNFSTGIAVGSNTADATLVNSGPIAIETTNFNSNALYSTSFGANIANSITNSGAITVTNSNPGGTTRGVAAFENGVDATSTLEVVSTGSISVSSSGYADGIAAFGSGNVSIDASAPIDVSGGIANGVRATSRQGDLSVAVGDVTVDATAVGSGGIRANADLGAVLIDADGTIAVSGNSAPGVFARGLTGVTMTGGGAVSTTGDNSNGVDVLSGAGPVDLTIGDINTSGELSGGVRAIGGLDSDVTVSTGSITTTGTSGSNYSFLPTSTAITAQATGTGNVSVTSGAISTAGLGAVGVNASAGAGDVSVTIGDVSTVGGRANGVTAQSAGGDVLVSTGTISTAGDGATGVYAVGGAVTVDTGNVTTTGFNARGINAIGAGGVDVGFGSITTDGTFSSGVSAISTGGDVVVSGADIDVGGASTYALYAASDVGDVSVTTTGTVSSDGRGGIGIFASSAMGDTNVSVNNVSVIAADDADAATSRGAIFASGANVEVTVSGTAATGGSATYGGNGNAVTAVATAGDATLVINNASTLGDNADAINATATGTTGIALTGSATTAGANSRGIYARGAGGVLVDGGGSVSTLGDGSNAVEVTSAAGPVGVTLGNISTAGELSGGVRAIGGTDSNVTITTGNVTTTGTSGSNYSFLPNSTAILAQASGTGNVAVAAGNVSTAGLGAAGVNAIAAAGDVAVSTAAVTTTGDRARGIDASSAAGDVSVVSTGAIATTGDQATGIYAAASLGGVSIDAQSLSTQGFAADAIDVTAGVGGADVGFTDVSAAGTFANGVSASATGGDVAVSGANAIVSGDVATAISAASDTGNVSVTTTGSVAATGRGGSGIYAISDTGNASITANNVSTVAADAGDTATSRAAVYASGANATVVVTGTAQTQGIAQYGGTATAVTAIGTAGDASATVNNVSATGAGISAVVVTATGDASATLNGRVRSQGAGAGAVVVTGGDNATVSVGANGNVTADSGNSITLTSVDGSTLNNAGIIANNASGFAVAAVGGPLTINNSGSLTSDILFTAGEDQVDNAGTFLVGPNPDFGAGADVFNNSGIVRLAPGATAPVAATFTGLETFNNNGGLVELRNGVAGDTLRLPGTFTGTAASRLGLDVNFGTAPVADRLIIGGAATGSTDVVLNFTGPAALNSGVVLVQSGAGTQAGAFSLADGTDNVGLIQLGLVFSPTANTFTLVGAPGDAVFRTASFVEGTRNLWHKSADAWSGHMRELRDGAWANGAGEAGGRLWGQSYGSVDKYDDVSTVNNFGLNRTLDLGYKQDYFGGQLGFDFGGAAGENGNFAFGVTGGYLNSRMNFNGVADRLEFDAFNAGVYASYNSGGLFANALAKYDHYKIDSTSASGQYSADFDGNSYGAQGEIGFRFGSDSFYVEPVGTIAYVRTDLDDFTAQNSTVTFRDDDGLRGKLGARIGASFPSSSVNTVVIYAGGHYVHEFKGDDSIDFTNGGQTIRVDNRAIGDFGEAVAGVNIGSANGVSGFIEANGAKGKDYEAFGARVGLRVRF